MFVGGGCLFLIGLLAALALVSLGASALGIEALRAGPRMNVDSALMRVVDVGLAFPFLLLVMAIGAGFFVIGDEKVRPRVEAEDGKKPASFKRDQRLNLWMQVYKLTMDEKTKKPSATVQYDLINSQTNKSVVTSTESTDQMGNVGDQLTLEKSMALNSVEPGLYVPGFAGFRHSDTVVITEDGRRVMTDYPSDLKDLVIGV